MKTVFRLTGCGFIAMGGLMIFMPPKARWSGAVFIAAGIFMVYYPYPKGME